MAEKGTIALIRESFELARAHFHEVGLALLALFILNLVASYSGSLVSELAGLNRLGNDYSQAMQLATLSIVALIPFAIAYFIFIMAISILIQAGWFYVFAHFYGILAGKARATGGWKEKIKGFAANAVFLMLFYLAAAVLFSLPVVPAFFLGGVIWSVAAAFAMVACWFAFIFLMGPLWIYYAMEGKALVDSARASFSLVAGSIFRFSKLYLVFIGIGIAVAVACIMLCCLSPLLMPASMMFVQLLTGIALMKLKLELDPPKGFQPAAAGVKAARKEKAARKK